MDTIPCSLQSTMDMDLDYMIHSINLSPSQRFAIDMQRRNFVRKYEESNASADDAAYTLFKEINARVVEDNVLRNYFDPLLREVFNHWCHDTSFEISDVLQRSDIGPGSVVSGQSRTSFMEKFSRDVTYTNPGLLRLFKAACMSDPRWTCLDNYLTNSGGYLHVKGGTATAVPKTNTISRIVVTPPSLNIFIDKGVGSVIESILRKLGIHLDTQPNINRWMAKKGSTDGKFSTIDCSSASDTLYHRIWCGDKILPSPLRWWIDITRPEFIKVKDEWVPLHMVQSMGSGLTFPLQTLIFLAITRVAYSALGLRWSAFGRNRSVSVFGDDIIVDTRAYELVISLLNAYGCIPNVSKSFNTGPFRESCGTDWHNGVNVRSYYIKRCKTEGERFAAVNGLVEWACRLKLPVPYYTISYLMSLNKRNYFVPMHAPVDSGIRVPSEMLFSHPYGSYKALVNVASEVEFIDVGHPIVILSVLRGECHMHRDKRKDTLIVTRRSLRTRYKVRRFYTPNWDFIPNQIGEEYWSKEGVYGRDWELKPGSRAWISFWPAILM